MLMDLQFSPGFPFGCGDSVSHKVSYILHCSLWQHRAFCFLALATFSFGGKFSFGNVITKMSHHSSNLSFWPHFLWESSGFTLLTTIFSWKKCKREKEHEYPLEGKRKSSPTDALGYWWIRMAVELFTGSKGSWVAGKGLIQGVDWVLKGKACVTGNKMMHFVSTTTTLWFGDKLVLNQVLGNS